MGTEPQLKKKQDRSYRLILVCLCLAFVSWLIPAAPLQAEQLNGGNTFQYATSALTLPYKVQQYMIHTRASSVSTNQGSWSNMTSAISFNYGYRSDFEIEITTIIYQDLNLASDYIVDTPTPEDEIQSANIPDNVYLRWKYGNIRMLGSTLLFFGLQGSTHFRLSKNTINNVWLEPYYGDKMALQLNLLFSYIANPLYPEDGFQLNYNVGYANMNDGISFTESTDALKIYFGMYYPFNPRFSGTLEAQGTVFLGYPEFSERLYSIEDFGYITPSFKYKFSSLVAYQGGVDILFFEGKDNTSLEYQPADFPNYPSWRVSSKLIFTPLTGGVESPGFAPGSYYQPGAMPMSQQPGVGGAYGAANRAALYDWGGSVKDDVQYIEVELDKIREDRRKAEEKLQKIKKKLKEK